jgi:hypothetical protein
MFCGNGIGPFEFSAGSHGVLYARLQPGEQMAAKQHTVPAALSWFAKASDYLIKSVALSCIQQLRKVA